jgi:hypothetical protein
LHKKQNFYLGKFVEYGDEVCIVAAGEDLRLRGEEIVAKLVQKARHQHVQVSTAINTYKIVLQAVYRS